MERLLMLLLLSAALAVNHDPVWAPAMPVPPAPAAPAAGFAPSAPEPGESRYAPLPPRKPAEGLQAVKESLMDQADMIQEKHGVRILLAGVGQDHIIMEIRKLGGWDGELSDTDLAAIKATLYEIAGAEFPLRLTVRTCCDREADVTGKIAQYDAESNRILIVNEHKKNGQSDDPEAYWVGLAEDGVLTVDGEPVHEGLGSALIGREAKVWTTGLMLQSYPGQTLAVKVEAE